MSDTPRTDAELRKPIHDTGIHNNLTEFCRELERENAELLKYKERMEWLLATFDVVELVKDKERLDWLIDNASISMIRKDEDGEEWWVELAYSEPREDIDKAMEESQ